MAKKTVKNVVEQSLERWDLKAVSMTDAAEIQESLETGYEPFSVSQMMKKQESALLSAGKDQIVMETLIWLKRKVLVPVGLEAVPTDTATL
jgi:hypothetical protein